jgi:enolase
VAWEQAKTVGMGGIMSARSGESEDVTLCHLAVGWGVPQIKVGSIARGERTAKWNELLRIADQARLPFAGARGLLLATARDATGG